MQSPDVPDPYLTGQILIAMPAMEDPRFAHSVVYLCAHTDEGAMGIMLNRPLAKPSFDDLLKQLEVEPAPPARRIQLCSGGPVDNGRGFVLHTADWTGDGSLRVNDRVALTASLDVLKAIAEGGGPESGLLALGYAGWVRASWTPRFSRTPGCQRRWPRRSCSTRATKPNGGALWRACGSIRCSCQRKPATPELWPQPPREMDRVPATR